MGLRITMRGLAVCLALLGLLAAPASERVAAQDATPAPVDRVETAAPCGEWLGVGDATVACLLVVHLSPGAPAVDVWADGAVRIPGLQYGTDSGYLPFPAGPHDVVITPAGGAIDQVLWAGSLTVEAGLVYHAVATGTLAVDDAADFGLAIFARTVGSWAAGLAIVEVIHAAPGAPDVDLAPTGGGPLVAGLPYGARSDDLTLPVGAYDFIVSPTGTTLATVAIIGAQVEAGHIYTIYIFGTADPTDAFDLAAYVVDTHAHG
jgi:hypothetical protein